MHTIQQLKDFLKEYSSNEEILLQFIDEKENEEDNFQLLKKNISNNNIHKNKRKLNLFLHLIAEITKNHYQSSYFFQKIQRIFKEYGMYIKQYFTNLDIFDIFKSNKYIIIMLLEEKICYIDESIANSLHKYDNQMYIQYFYPEIQHISNINHYPLFDNDPELFKKMRKERIHESEIYQIIQKDLLDEFIIHINLKNIPLNSIIDQSIFESNPFLLNNSKISLIEYAAFFGSIRIFNYLKNNQVSLTPSLWLFAIHSNNPEIINALDENGIIPKDETYEECLIESIKCHHNDITNYIIQNYLLTYNDKSYLHHIIITYNFIALSEMLNDDSFDLYDWSIIDENAKRKEFIIFYDFFIHDYYEIIDFLIENVKIEMICVNNIEIEKYLHSSDKYLTKKYVITTASEFNNLEMVQRLLSNPRIDVNSISLDYKMKDTALTYAVKNNNFEMTQLLMLNPSINVNIKSIKYYDEETALAIAVRNNNIEIAKVLLSNSNIDVNIRSIKYNDKETPLFVAVKNKNIEMIKALLKHPKIDVNNISIFKSREETPLGFAIENENIEIIELLLTHKLIDPNPIVNDLNKSECALINLVRKNKNEIIKLILDNSNINERIQDIDSLLPLAIWYHNTDIFYRLSSFPNINVNSTLLFNDNIELTTLDIALMQNNNEIAEFLLSSFPNININLNSNYSHYRKNYYVNNPLNIAIQNNNIQMVKLLLDNPKIDVNLTSKINKTIETPLNLAIKNNNINIVKLLLDNPKIDINSFSIDNERENKQGALYTAVINNNIEIVNLILNHPNIDLNIQHKCNNLYELLIIAIQNKNIEIMKLLINIDINDTNIPQALIAAIESNDRESIFLLLSSYPDIYINYELKEINNNIRDKNRKTLIQYISYIESVSLLYAYNYDIWKDFKYYDKKTPLAVALKNNNIKIIKLFLNNSKIDVNSKYTKDCKIETPLNIAIYNGNMEIINILLSNPQIDVNFTPKIEKIEQYTNNFYLFCERKNCKYEGETALMAAIMNNNIEVVKLLLSRTDIEVNGKSIYFDPYKQEKTSLYAAIEKENIEIIKLLLSHPKIDVNSFSKFIKIDDIFEKKYTEKAPIHLAVEKGNIEIIKLLIANQTIDVNSEMLFSNENEDKKQVQKKTSLHIAIENRNIDILKLLLEIPSLNINSKIFIENYIYNYITKYSDYPEVVFIYNPECYYDHIEITKKKEKQQFIENPEFRQILRRRKQKMYKEEHANFEIKTPIFIPIENDDLEITELLLSRQDININIKSEFVDQKKYFGPYDENGLEYYYNKSFKTVQDIAVDKGNNSIIQKLIK